MSGVNRQISASLLHSVPDFESFEVIGEGRGLVQKCRGDLRPFLVERQRAARLVGAAVLSNTLLVFGGCGSYAIALEKLHDVQRRND